MHTGLNTKMKQTEEVMQKHCFLLKISKEWCNKANLWLGKRSHG